MSLPNYISKIKPVFKKGACSDPSNYRPIVVLPTLSHVFRLLLISQLQRQISPRIPSEQFGFLKGSSTSDAGVSLASTISTAINQRAEIRLVALDIKGAFDHVRWDSVLNHLWSIGCCAECFVCLSPIYQIDISRLSPILIHLTFILSPQVCHRVAFGHHYYSIYTFDCFQACQDIVQWLHCKNDLVNITGNK